MNTLVRAGRCVDFAPRDAKVVYSPLLDRRRHHVR
jgi:hypothetical protein